MISGKGIRVQLSRAERITIYGNLKLCILALKPIEPMGKLSSLYWLMNKFLILKAPFLMKLFSGVSDVNFNEKTIHNKIITTLGGVDSIVKYENSKKTFNVFLVEENNFITGYLLSGERESNYYEKNNSIAPSLLFCIDSENASHFIYEYIVGDRKIHSHLTENHFYLLRELNKLERGPILKLTDYIEKTIIKFPFNEILLRNNFTYQILNWKSKLAPIYFSTGITHGDFSPYNIIFTNNGDAKLIDWEFSEAKGILLFDLIYYHLCVSSLFKKCPINATYSNIVADAKIFLMKIDLNHEISEVIVLCDLIEIIVSRISLYPDDPITLKGLNLLKFILLR